MTTTVNENRSDVVYLSIKDQLLVNEVSGIKAFVEKALSESKQVAFDFGLINKIDIAGYQLLYALKSIFPEQFESGIMNKVLSQSSIDLLNKAGIRSL